MKIKQIKQEKAGVCVVIAFGTLGLITFASPSGLASPSTNVQGVVNIPSTSRGETIVHTCSTPSYDACALYIGTADRDTTVKGVVQA